MSSPRIREGHFTAKGRRFAIIVARFNHFIVDRLVEGAVDTLIRHGCVAEEIEIFKVPGAWELPLIAQRVAAKGGFDGVLALGAVIRGATPHFDFVASEAAKGLAQVSLKSETPIAFGVLTTDTIEQAIERAGTKAGNKGGEAALALIETVDLLHKIDGAAE